MSEVVNIDTKPTMTHTFAAEVVVGSGQPKLVPSDPAKWLATLAKFPGPVKVSIERPRRKHSDEARGYLWGVVYVDVLAGLRQLAMDAGEECPFRDDDELHDAMKYLCFGMDVITLAGGVKVERRARTRDMDSRQYALFVDFVRRWAAERSIYTRDPGESVAV